MIRVSEDGKSFVEINTFEELLERPNFKQKLDPKKHTLKQIIGQYSIDPKQPCGISSCGTKHNRGYLVAVSEGLETNIGNVCGKRIFGVEFTQHHQAFKKELNAQRFRENIDSAQNRLGSVTDKVIRLREGEHKADWCHEKMHAYITRLFPENISKKLIARAKMSNPIVTRDVRLTEDEVESGATGSSSQFRTETIFIISGVNAAISYKKLKTVLYNHLGDELEAFKEIDSSSIDFKSLKRWHNWINKIEQRTREAEDIITDCNRFLVTSNIQKIRNYQTFL